MIFIDLVKKQLAKTNMILERTREQLKQFSDLEKGSLTKQIRSHNNCYYYLSNAENGTRKNKYLGKNDEDIVLRYKAQRFYKEREKSLAQNQKVLSRAVRSLEDDSIEAIVNRLPDSYRHLPSICYEDDQYQKLKAWAKEKFQRNPYKLPDDPNIACDGTITRSKGETLIYDDVLCEGLLFQYDVKIRLKGRSGIYHNLYPDFLFKSITGELIAWEHLGMMDLEDYANRVRDRIEEYLDCGFILGDNLFFTSDGFDSSTSEVMILDMIELIKNKIYGSHKPPYIKNPI